MDNGDQSFTLFFGEESQNGETAENFWRKFPLFFSQKKFSKLLSILGEHVVTSQSVSVSVYWPQF
jgi:hypothetical protein